MRRQTTFSVVVLFAICGCGGGGSAGPSLVSATGTVTYQGKPVSGATVQMVGEKTNSTGFTDANGKFKMTTGGRPGVPVGALKVGITKYAGDAAPAETKKMKPEDMMAMQKEANRSPEDLKPKSEIPEKYADPERSKLVATIDTNGSKNVFEYDLVD